jgi:NAD(P)H-quinone oxidoreductase subunit 5
MLMVLPAVFFILLGFYVVSALVLLSSKVPLHYVRIHIGIATLPLIVALLSLIFIKGDTMYGPWRLNSLSWLLASFVLTIGLIVQRYSIRYLAGDSLYRKYISLLTFTTVADCAVWLSDDLRLFIICWGITLLSLTFLIRLNKRWTVAKNAAKLSGYQFALSWCILIIVTIWLTHITGHWRLSSIMEKNSLSQLGSWEKFTITLLLIISAVIPSSQWPFHRWLLESVVAPTPVSAVMHAGIVNAGGMMLTRFAPLISGDWAQIILLVLSIISVLMGTGIMFVHVDYKRQLVGSTIAQMGFMLLQCSLGAFSAAIIHAVLHGLFKSTLFLQAGSAIEHHTSLERTGTRSPFLWTISGAVLGCIIGVGYWLTSSGEVYQLISAITLGLSLSIAWIQLVANGNGLIGRMTGFSLLAGIAVLYCIIHSAFSSLLHNVVLHNTQTGFSSEILLVVILLIASGAVFWFATNRSSKFMNVIYLWIVRLGEPREHFVESQPTYLSKNVTQGGRLR